MSSDEIFEGASNVRTKVRIKTLDGKILTGTVPDELPDSWSAEGLAEFVTGRDVQSSLSLPAEKGRRVGQTRSGKVKGKALATLIREVAAV